MPLVKCPRCGKEYDTICSLHNCKEGEWIENMYFLVIILIVLWVGYLWWKSVSDSRNSQFIKLIEIIFPLAIAYIFVKKQIVEHYEAKVLELREEFLDNFRRQPSIPIIPMHPVEKDINLATIREANSYKISNLIAVCSLGSFMNFLLKKERKIEEISDYQRGLVVLFGIWLISLKPPSIVKNWVNGEIVYKPDIRKMNKAELLKWIVDYQKAISGLEFAWSNNKNKVLGFIKDSISYIKNTVNPIDVYLEFDYDTIEKILEEYFVFLYRNLAICEKLKFLVHKTL